ncbi:MAG: GNAT family N-acetyltransferase [Gammaproteobacteria bacterium]|nr:GNAT family N-acetyltransferase [Gammaproteobacteria bacterium]
MSISYFHDKTISSQQFIDLLKRSTLAERRPVDKADVIAGMLANADILITAWQGEQLVGVARSVSDFTYCCYLSDLAVDQNYQHLGIGKTLQQETLSRIGAQCTLILLAAPKAHDYYKKIGFSAHPRCWVLAPGEKLKP